METTLKPNDIVSLTIDAYGSKGQGIGRHNGMTVFVPGALVNEKITAVIEKTTPSYAVGKMTDLVGRSSDRRDPACPYYEECGGCDLMHMSYPAQLSFKTQRVKDALTRLGGFADIKVEPCIGTDDPTHYRNKAVFSFAEHDERVVSGCIAEKSHRVVPVKSCLIQSGIAEAALKAVTDWANGLGIRAYNERTGKGCIRHLLVRTTSLGETMVVIIAAKPFECEKELVSSLRAAVPSLKSLIVNLNPGRTSLILGRKSRVAFGNQTIRENVCGLEFSVAAESFLQVNTVQMRKLYSKAVGALELDRRDSVLDLYCGIGTISLLMAQQAGSVTGVEAVAPAIEDAKRSAKANGIDNAEFFCANVEDLLPQLIKKGQKINKVMLDPPRKGAMPEAIDAIAASGAERICYVSCDPSTLARDCKQLAAAGYRIEAVQPFDMFPQTSHVECVVLMSRVKG